MLVNFKQWVALNENLESLESNIGDLVNQFFIKFMDELDDACLDHGYQCLSQDNREENTLFVQVDATLENEEECEIKIIIKINYREPKDHEITLLEVGMIDVNEFIEDCTIEYIANMSIDGENYDISSATDNYDITTIATSSSLSSPNVEMLIGWIDNSIEDCEFRIHNGLLDNDDEEDEEEWEED